MNVELLTRIRDYILEEPRRLRMDHWVIRCSEDFCPCGTMGCIAGWALILSGRSSEEVSDAQNTAGEAATLLEINCFQAAELFFVGHWPHEFAFKYHSHNSPEQNAKVTAQRIDAFIAKYAKEKDLSWLRSKVAIEDESLVSVGGLASRLEEPVGV